jgi:hypothetical protein
MLELWKDRRFLAVDNGWTFGGFPTSFLLNEIVLTQPVKACGVRLIATITRDIIF